jgi:glutathione synthase/RimK-type ligase-like ATP-grasp enzyme
MKTFGAHLQEAVDDKKYKLVILSHDDPHDPNETWILIRDKAEALGLTVLLAEFVGTYTKKTPDGKRFIHSFGLDKEGKVIMPSAKNKDVEYAKPFEIDPSDTLIMARGIGTSAKSGNRSWGDMCKVFEYEGYTVINSTECHNICNDKWMNNLIFKRENFNTPKTVRINHPEGAKWALGELDADFPLILKTAAGSRGIGVMWIESEKALHGLVQLLYRVCAGKILGAIKRPIVDGDFRSNVSQGSEPELHELTEIEASESIRAADAVGGLLTGVDFIPAKNREKDKPYFIEVNSTPGLMGIESTLSGAAAKPLGKKLKKEGSSITTEILTRFLDRKHWVKK